MTTETAVALSGTRQAQQAKRPKLFDQAFRDASAAKHAADIDKLRQAFLNLGADVVAGNNAKLMSWRQTDLKKLLEKNPGMGPKIQGVLGRDVVRKLAAQAG